jgi:hypothetical protein
MEFAVFYAVNAHAARWDDREAECAVINGDYFNALLFSPVKGGFRDRPTWGGRGDGFPVQLHGGNAQVFARARKRLAVCVCADGSGR